MMSRQGMALLVALAAVIVVLAALAGTLRQLAATQRAVLVCDMHDRHYDLLSVGERLTCTWIMRNGDRLVVPPAGGGIRVADDLLALGDDRARLQVWVYDALAAVPLRSAQSTGDLRGALPGRWSAVALPPPTPDLAPVVDVIERTRLPQGLQRYPTPGNLPSGPIVGWSGVGVPAPREEPLTAPGLVSGLSLVEVIASASDGRINRNTAPEWLLTAVYAQRERGDLTAALRLRERLAFNDQEDPEGPAGIRLVASSDRWNAMILVTWNGRRRTWWVELSGNSAGVRIVQRHDADQ